MKASNYDHDSQDPDRQVATVENHSQTFYVTAIKRCILPVPVC